MRDPASWDGAPGLYLGGWDEGLCHLQPQWSQAYASKTLAEEALTEELRRRDQGIILNQERITLREFSRRWLDHMATLGHDERTLERYRELLDLHVLPTIGGLQLKAVQPLHLSDLYVRLLTGGRRDGKPGGLKPRTVGHVHRAIHRMLKQALRWRLIALNPASDLELPAVQDEPMVTLTVEQARTLLEAARPRPWLHALILLGWPPAPGWGSCWPCNGAHLDHLIGGQA